MEPPPLGDAGEPRHVGISLSEAGHAAEPYLVSLAGIPPRRFRTVAEAEAYLARELAARGEAPRLKR